MKRTAYLPGREEPTLSDTSGLDIVAEEAIRQPRAELPRPGWIRRLLWSLSRLLLLVLIIIGVSYLPESWIQQQHPHVQDAVHICRDVRGFKRLQIIVKINSKS